MPSIFHLVSVHAPPMRQHLVWTLLLITVSLSSSLNPTQGQGIVSVDLSNRGDWSIIGDNLSNSVAVLESGDDVLVQGQEGTLIRRNIPGLPIETAASIRIPKSNLLFLRNVTIDLKQGDNSMLMFYLPEFIGGSLSCRLGSGANILGLVPNESVEILEGISIRGSRSNQAHQVVVGDPNFYSQKFIETGGDISIDLKSSANVIWLFQAICDRNLSIKMAGTTSEVECFSVGVVGKTALRIAPSSSSQTLIGFSYFGGKTTISHGNGHNRLTLTEVNCDGEVVAKFGRGDDRLFVENSVFNHPKGASFDGGRGQNLYGEQFNNSFVPLEFKNFSSYQ